MHNKELNETFRIMLHDAVDNRWVTDEQKRQCVAAYEKDGPEEAIAMLSEFEKINRQSLEMVDKVVLGVTVVFVMVLLIAMKVLS